MKSFVFAVLGLGPLQVVQVGDPPTFSRDIAPIVFENCISCHRSGGSAPFSLETYEDVSRRARQIMDVGLSAGDALREMQKHLLAVARPATLPDPMSVGGLPFAEFANLEEYERAVLARQEDEEPELL